MVVGAGFWGIVLLLKVPPGWPWIWDPHASVSWTLWHRQGSPCLTVVCSPYTFLCFCYQDMLAYRLGLTVFVKRWHYFPLFDFSFERTNLAISSSSQTMANIPSFPVTKTHLHDPSPMSSSMTLHLCLPQWHFTYPTSMTLSITSHLNDTLSELTQLRDKSFKRPCQCVRGQVATPCCYILCFCCPLWMWPCWRWRLQCPLPIVPWSTQHTAARKRAALYKIKCSKKSL